LSDRFLELPVRAAMRAGLPNDINVEAICAARARHVPSVRKSQSAQAD
jgi:hypothetical protein